MTPRAAVRLAWGLWGLAVALLVAAMALGPWLLLGYVGVQGVLSLAFLTVGAFLAGRRPGNAVGCRRRAGGRSPGSLRPST